MNAKKTPNDSALGWLETIAEKAKCSRDEVATFMEKYKINQSHQYGVPNRITINSISFSGTKEGMFDNDFQFEFDKLSNDLWGIFSDGNGKGKSSIIGVIKWLFRGTVPSELQAGVRSWIRKAEIRFSLGGNGYSIGIQQDGGNVFGAIRMYKSPEVFISVSSFRNEEEMAKAVEEFMLAQLGLSQILTNRKGATDLDISTEVSHGWPALSSVMFIGTNYDAIFGENVVTGLHSRLLGLYLGLPWIPTLSALKALEGRIKSVEKYEVAHKDKTKQDRMTRLTSIRTQLADLRKRKSALPVPKHTMEEYGNLESAYTTLYFQHQAALRELSSMESHQAELEAAAKADKIALTKLKEEKAAHKIFKRLNPVQCPHCETKVTEERIRREQSDHHCAICDSHLVDVEEDVELLNERQQAADASEQVLRAYKAQIKGKRSLIQSLAEQVESKIMEQRRYRQQLEEEKQAASTVQSINHDIFRLEVLEAEYAQELETDSPSAPSTLDEQLVDENKILTVAIKVTEAFFAPLQETLLAEVSKKILDFCRKVGLDQYLHVELNGGPQLRITKDGSATSYSKVSPGEKLRLKVISTIALISVAEEQGYGRHPGFLVIDSPGAQEVSDETLQSLMTGLKELCSSVQSLQVIIASRANPVLLNAIPEEKRKYAKGNTFLW